MGRPKGSKNKKKTDAPKRKYTRRAPVATRGGNRSGAGRKSAEVHFAGLNAKIDLIMATMGLSAPAPVVEAVAPPVVTAEQVAAASAEAPKKRGPGRPRKIVTPPAEVIQKEPTRKLPDDPVVTMPAPVFAAPIPVAPVAPLAPPFAAQPQQVVQPTSAAPIQAPTQPVVFAPPPPVQAQPGFIAVAPVQIAPSLPVQPTANGTPDFDAQFNALPSVKPAQ